MHCVLLTEGSIVDPSSDILELTTLITTDGTRLPSRSGTLTGYLSH
jgi:hypothetical protein